MRYESAFSRTPAVWYFMPYAKADHCPASDGGGAHFAVNEDGGASEAATLTPAPILIACSSAWSSWRRWNWWFIYGLTPRLWKAWLIYRLRRRVVAGDALKFL